MSYEKVTPIILWLRAIALVVFICMGIAIILWISTDRYGHVFGIAPAPCTAVGPPLRRLGEPPPLKPEPGDVNYAQEKTNAKHK